MTISGQASPRPARPSRAVPLDFLHSEELHRAWPGLRHGFSLEWPRLDDAELGEVASAALGLGSDTPWIFQQPHGTKVLELGGGIASDAPSIQPVSVPGYDGAMVTASENGSLPSRATLILKAADCVSILAVLPKRNTYAALHAGWRGTAAGILPRFLGAWRARYGGLDGARLAFGPHIRNCCFEVKGDCLAQFAERDLDGAVSTHGGRTFISLERILKTQAIAQGIACIQIDALPQCTQCHRDASGAHPFASYRRSQREGCPAGRNIAFIGPVR